MPTLGPAKATRAGAVGEAPTLTLDEGELGDDEENSAAPTSTRSRAPSFVDDGSDGRCCCSGVVALAGGALVVARLRAEKPVRTESEPNNTAGYANLLASGTTRCAS